LKALLALGIGLVALAFPGAGAAQESCGDNVLRDWYDGRIDGVYPARCYRDALKRMPDDMRTYTSATEDISRELTERLRASPVKASAAKSHQSEAVRTTSGVNETAPAPSTRQRSRSEDPLTTTAGPEGSVTPPDSRDRAARTAEVLASAGGNRASATPPVLLALASGLLVLAAAAAAWAVRLFARRRTG
jgi:hypothetical protein